MVRILLDHNDALLVLGVETDGYLYVEIRGAMYGLSQSGRIANQDLQKHLTKYEYYPTKSTLGL